MAIHRLYTALFALQRTNNQMNKTYEYLAYLLKESFQAQQLIRSSKLLKVEESTKNKVLNLESPDTITHITSPRFQAIQAESITTSNNFESTPLPDLGKVGNLNENSISSRLIEIDTPSLISHATNNVTNSFKRREQNQKDLAIILGQLKSRKSFMDSSITSNIQPRSLTHQDFKLQIKKDPTIKNLLEEIDNSIENSILMNDTQSTVSSGASLGSPSNYWISLMHELESANKETRDISKASDVTVNSVSKNQPSIDSTIQPISNLANNGPFPHKNKQIRKTREKLKEGKDATSLFSKHQSRILIADGEEFYRKDIYGKNNQSGKHAYTGSAVLNPKRFIQDSSTEDSVSQLKGQFRERIVITYFDRERVQSR